MIDNNGHEQSYILLSSKWVCFPGFGKMHTDHQSPVIHFLVIGILVKP